SGQDDALYVFGAERIVERPAELVDHRRIQRVPALGPVHDDLGDSVARRYLNQLVGPALHGVSAQRGGARFRISRACSMLAGFRPTSRHMRSATSTIAAFELAICPFGR